VRNIIYFEPVGEIAHARAVAVRVCNDNHLLADRNKVGVEKQISANNGLRILSVSPYVHAE
jgi:hypothetical protein